MSRPSRPEAPRYRRRIVTVGLIAALVLFSIGFPIFNNRIEDDLERRVPAELTAAGFAGVTATFSGQDGTLRCAQPLDDPEQATSIAYGVWGVRKVTLDRLCRVNRAPTVETAASDATTASDTSGGATTADTGAGTTVGDHQYATIGEAIAGDQSLSFLDVLVRESGLTAMLDDPAAAPLTVFAPTDAAFDALPADVNAQLRSDPDLLSGVLARHVASGAIPSTDLAGGQVTMMDGSAVTVTIDGGAISIDGASVTTPDLVTANGIVHIVDRVLLPTDFEAATDEPAASVGASLDGGALTLSGVVASEVERAALIGAAVAGAGDDNVVDQLSVDPDIGLGGELSQSLAMLIAAMPTALVSGVAGFDGTGLYVNGIVLSTEANDQLLATAAEVGADADLAPRPPATEADAAALEVDLNEFVAAIPVTFEPSSALLTADAAGVLDELAARALAFAGVAITVEGHTDSDGDPAGNLTLSQQRAEAVRVGLVDRGLDAGAITAEGFGAEQLVVVDGVEDKAASRRVEFRIDAAT